MVHWRQQYRWSPWSEALHLLNLTFWPSEEPIFSYLNTELPQQTTQPSSWGELLGWGQHGHMETAGTTRVQEAHIGARSRLIQKLDPREIILQQLLTSLYASELHGVEQDLGGDTCPQNDGAFGLVAPVDLGFGLPWCVFLAVAVCKPIPKKHPTGPDRFFHFSFAVVPPQRSDYMAISRETAPCTLLLTQADTLKMH